MYRKLSDDVVVIQDTSSNIKTLNGGFWMVQLSQELGYHLVRQDPMTLPEKVYGANHGITDKIFKTFTLNSGKTTGVMLQGAKGTGKTLTAIEVSLKAVENNIPVIMIQSQFYGSDFNDFMCKITEPAVIFIDEFEKVYHKQEAINHTLMLLDGAIKTTKLFLLTSNTNLEDNNTMSFLQNRPSRVLYVFEYGSIEDSVIEEYLQDNLKFPVYGGNIKAIKRAFKLFTIDMLKAIVTEVNRFGDVDGKVNFFDIIHNLNVKTDRGLDSYQYEKTLIIGDKRFPLEDFMPPDSLYEVSSWKFARLVDNDDACTLYLSVPHSYVSDEEVGKLSYSSAVSLDRNSTYNSLSECPAINVELDKRITEAKKKNVNTLSAELGNAFARISELSESEIEKCITSHHRQKPIATRLRISWWEHYVDLDEIEYSQNEYSRAITVSFGKDIKIEFKPKIAPSKKFSRFII